MHPAHPTIGREHVVVSRSSLCKGSDLCAPCGACIANSSVLSSLPTNTPDFHLLFQMFPSTERPLNMQVSPNGLISPMKLLHGVCPDASTCIRLTTFAPVSVAYALFAVLGLLKTDLGWLGLCAFLSKACSGSL